MRWVWWMWVEPVCSVALNSPSNMWTLGEGDRVTEMLPSIGFEQWRQTNQLQGDPLVRLCQRCFIWVTKQFTCAQINQECQKTRVGECLTRMHYPPVFYHSHPSKSRTFKREQSVYALVPPLREVDETSRWLSLQSSTPPTLHQHCVVDCERNFSPRPCYWRSSNCGQGICLQK